MEHFDVIRSQKKRLGTGIASRSLLLHQLYPMSCCTPGRVAQGGGAFFLSKQSRGRKEPFKDCGQGDGRRISSHLLAERRREKAVGEPALPMLLDKQGILNRKSTGFQKDYLPV